MNRTKKLYILSGVLLVLIIICFAVTRIQKDTEKIKTEGICILSIEPSDVTKLSVKSSFSDISLTREDGWKLDSDESFPVDSGKVDDILDIFSEFNSSFTIEDVKDYSLYGLKKPSCTITLTAGDKEYRVEAGDYSNMDKKRYVSIGDGNVYLVDNDPEESFSIDRDDIIVSVKLPVVTELDSMSVSGSSSFAISRNDKGKSYCSEDEYFIEELPLDSGRLTDYFGELANLRISNYVSYDSVKDTGKYGLSEPTFSAELNYKEGSKNSLYYSFSLGSTGDDEDKKYYFTEEGSPLIYEISSDDYETLATAPEELRHQEIFSGEFEDISSVEVNIDGSAYSLSSKGKGENKKWNIEGAADKDEVDMSTFKDKLNLVKAESFTDEKASGLKQEISLKLVLSDNDYESMDMAFYRYDGILCLAYVNGSPWAFVPRSSAMALVEAVNEIVL